MNSEWKRRFLIGYVLFTLILTNFMFNVSAVDYSYNVGVNTLRVYEIQSFDEALAEKVFKGDCLIQIENAEYGECLRE